MVECGFGSRTSSGWRATPRGLDEAEASGWTPGGVDLSGEAHSSLDMCHHLEASQIDHDKYSPKILTKL